MIIQIKRLFEPVESDMVVEFESELGIGRGIWYAYNAAPIVGTDYGIEMDILDKLKLGENVRLIDTDDYRLEWNLDQMLLQGQVDCNNDQSMVWIEIRDRHSNVNIDVDIPELADYKKQFVQLEVYRIGLADMNL
jgi:hypothetical protein